MGRYGKGLIVNIGSVGIGGFKEEHMAEICFLKCNLQ
jgi:hypothetical protein